MDFEMEIDNKTKEWFDIVEEYWNNTPPPDTIKEFQRQSDELQNLLNKLDEKYNKLEENKND